MRAEDILTSASATLISRGADRDQDEERSMLSAVALFNQMTGAEMSEEDGWAFMICLKLARAYNGPVTFNADHFIDLAGYSALLGEAWGKHDSD